MARRSEHGSGWMVLAAGAMLASPTAATGTILPENVLVLYNSQQPESQAVRDMYVAAHPGVLEFDLNSTALGPLTASRNRYLNSIRTPLLNFLNGIGTGEDVSSQVIVIVTTRGLPGLIVGAFEGSPQATFASLESELTLIHQDLEATGGGGLTERRSSMVDNPYHRQFGQPITGWDRAQITAQRTFTPIPSSPSGFTTWRIDGLTPGDIYLVCRIDAAPDATGDALGNIAALLDRSAPVRPAPEEGQVLLDEFGSFSQQLDDDGLAPNYPDFDDFSATAGLLSTVGYLVTHDESADFIEASELSDPRPLLVLGSYGENHDADEAGQNPPGAATYIDQYTFHPASVFIAYESFSGTSLFDPDGPRTTQQEQALDAIAAGVTFTAGSVKEPFTFTVPDLQPLAFNLYLEGLTFAEAIYSAMPALSWMWTPIGDPLARMSPCSADINGDGATDAADLSVLIGNFGSAVAPGTGGDVNGDGSVDAADLSVLIGDFGCPTVGAAEAPSITR